MAPCRIAALAACVALVACPIAVRGDVLIPAGGEISLTSGALELACTDLVVAGTLHVGAAPVTSVRHFTIQPGGVVDATSGTISVGGTFTNQGTFAPGSGGVVFGNACGAGAGDVVAVPASSGGGLLLLAALIALLAFLKRRGHRP